MSTVLLSSSPQAPADDLRRILTAAGFGVADHSLGAAPAVDFGSIAVAVIETGDRAPAAAAQTRRWRAELGDRVVPILWVVPPGPPEAAVAGLDAGADACQVRPLDPAVFKAQVRAMARCHATAARLGAKAAEGRLLGEQLQKAYLQLDREEEMGRRLRRTVLPRLLPEVGAVRFAVCHRPRAPIGGDFYDIRRLDEDHVGFAIGHVVGRSGGSLLGLFARQAVTFKQVKGNCYRLVPPHEVLSAVNQELLALGLDDPPLVAMLAGIVNGRDGRATLARGGLPAPIYLPVAGEPQVWAEPGPFLGTAETTFPIHHGVLVPGDRLVMATDGIWPDGNPTAGPDVLGNTVARRRELAGQAFVDAVANDLLPSVRHQDDVILLSVQMLVAESGTDFLSISPC